MVPEEITQNCTRKQKKEHKIALEKDIETALVWKQTASRLEAVKKSLREIARKPRVYPQ